MSSILNQAIAGLKRLLKNREFTPVKRGLDVLDQYQNKATSIESYLMNIVHDENIDGGLFVYEIFEHYTSYMRLLYGDNWAFDKDVSIRNSTTLVSSLRQYFADKSIIIISKTKWASEKQQSLTFYKFLRFKNENDIILESINNDEIEIDVSMERDEEFPINKEIDF